MITCPQCQSKNPSDATLCQFCRHQLQSSAPAGDGAIPAWLQQLKPADDATPLPAADAAPAPTASAATTPDRAQAPAAARVPDQAATAPVEPATSNATPARPTTAQPAEAAASAEEATAAAKSTTGQVETASLVSEDDLPAWLRAFNGNVAEPKAADVEVANTSWMTGDVETDGTSSGQTDNLAQTWQARGRSTDRSGAGSLFAKVTERAPAPAAARQEPVGAAASHGARAASDPVAGDQSVAPTGASVATAAGRAARTPASAERSRGGGKVALMVVLVLILLLVALGIAAKMLGLLPF